MPGAFGSQVSREEALLAANGAGGWAAGGDEAVGCDRYEDDCGGEAGSDEIFAVVWEKLMS